MESIDPKETAPEEKVMLSTSRMLVFVIFLIAAFGISGWYIWDRIPNSDSLRKGTTTDEGLKNLISEENAKDSASEEDVKELIKAQMPSLTREIPADANADAVSKITAVIKTLTENYDYLQGWLNLGIFRKAANDYNGAIEAWKFATILRPKSSTAFLNLGDLYGWYLKDNAKAEQYLLAGIAAEPNSVYPYYKTYEFYVDIMKDTAKARKVLQDGIASNPDSSQDLKTALSNL
ncbi:MAG: hypothetical protein HYT22_01945 [Candidatus Niyogibacteria bacterium]|nr:hypothetical protein [Candidatus Niyogibacteria bacterium]